MHWNSAVSSCLERRCRLLHAGAENIEAVVRQHYAATESELNAWVTFNAPALDGIGVVPVGVKDVIDVRGHPTRAGSRSRAEALPAADDAEVVTRLAAKGFRAIGKTVTTEFAYRDPGGTTNPFSPMHTPGGSSSGSAAAVGAGVVPLALGTQTAGSMCRPAAYCGTYAFKPTTGRTPLRGVVPLAPTFDTVGVFGLDPELVAQATAAILDLPFVPDIPEARALSIGYLEDEEYLDLAPDCAAVIADALELLRSAGHRLEPLRLCWDFDRVRYHHRCVMQKEAWINHQGVPDTRIGDGWRNALEAGRALSTDIVESARKHLAYARAEALLILQSVDLVLMPPVRTTAPLGLASTGDAGLLIPWTVIGSPLAIAPTGLTPAGMPLAVMLAGRPDDDAGILSAFRQISDLFQANGRCID